jgi:hypothetical protein
MRRDEPNRHGRAADALIASYLRELLAEDETDAAFATPLTHASGEPSPAAIAPASDALAPRGVEATL